MPIQILMPALSPTMEQGKLAKWLVKVGDKVTAGTIIAEIETDKATMDIEAVDDGTVGRILIPEGTDGVAVNAPIAMLLAEGEDSSVLDAVSVGDTAKKSATPLAARAGKANGNGNGARIFISPLARRIAKEKGLDLADINGSGPHGRIVLRDVEQVLVGRDQTSIAAQVLGGRDQTSIAAQVLGGRDQTSIAAQVLVGRDQTNIAAQVLGGRDQTSIAAQVLVPSRGGAAAPVAMPDEQIFAIYEQGSYELVPHDNMRRTIAQRLVQAKQTIPHFYLTIDCELDALMDARQRLNMRSPKDGAKAYRLSVNDFIVKAMGLALMRVPKANATWSEQGTLYHRHADIAVAVAVEGGLFTPVIRSVDDKSLVEIANQMRDFAERARKRRLAPHEYQGGTTSISNLGMYSIRQFDAVINPPHATILAVGQGEKRPVVKGDQLKIATVMTVTLSCDHRVVDGALGAQLLSSFKGFIEEPVTMLL